LKGGSGLGIPSPPAIWLADGDIVTPDIRDAERLQGFPADWTEPGVAGHRRVGARWKLVGNAVSVPVSRWLGSRLARPSTNLPTLDAIAFSDGDSWPHAAWGDSSGTYAAPTSLWPRHDPFRYLADFLEYETTPLSERAAAGFLTRARRGSLRFQPGFLDAVGAHIDRMSSAAVA
jgi:DNA (cytosine-5)-methyltransferase 1